MKKLSIEKMEKIEGGNFLTWIQCIATLTVNGMPSDYAGVICYYSEMYPVQ